MAYPNGICDKKSMQLTEAMGYKAAFTVHYGLCDPKTSNRYALPRIPIFGSLSHTLFRFKVRLWFAPVIEEMSDLQRILLANDLPFFAKLIPIP